MRVWWLLFGGLLGGLAGGYFLGAGLPGGAGGGGEDGSTGGTATSPQVEAGGPAAADAATELPKSADASEGASATFERVGALYRRIEAASLGEFPELMASLIDAPREMAFLGKSLLAARWVAVDPEGMLAYANQLPQRERWSVLNQVFRAWARKDLSAARAAVETMGSPRERASALNAIINELAESDPRRALAVAGDLEARPGNSQWIYRRIFSQWAQQDGATARQAALALPEGPEKVYALSGALNEWMQTRPMEALDWLDSLEMDSTIHRSRKEVFRSFLNSDFETARQFVEREQNPLKRRTILEQLHFNNFAWQRDYAEIEGLFDCIGTVATGQTYSNKVRGVVQAMAKSDLERAVDFTRQLGPGAARMNALNAIGSELAREDARRALDFVESLDYEDEKRRALGSMSWQLARYSLEGAAALAAESRDPIVQQSLAHSLASEWSNFDADKALDWSEQLTDPKARATARNAALANLVQSDPEAAFAYIDSLDPEAQQQAYSSTFADWARNDPEAAVEMLSQLPETLEDQRANVYRSVANAYVRFDPMAASRWISDLEAGPERDQSVRVLVNSISRTDPEAAFMWSETILDDGSRKNSLTQSVRLWIEQDVDAAYEGVAASKMDAAQKEPLLAMIEQAMEADAP